MKDMLQEVKSGTIFQAIQPSSIGQIGKLHYSTWLECQRCQSGGKKKHCHSSGRFVWTRTTTSFGSSRRTLRPQKQDDHKVEESQTCVNVIVRNNFFLLHGSRGCKSGLIHQMWISELFLTSNSSIVLLSLKCHLLLY